MVFASLIFLFVFLPLNLILYYSFQNKLYRNGILICFSLVFYSWGEPIWVVLLIFSALVDYVNGLVIEKYRGTIGEKIGLVSSILINLGLLGSFKYSGFLVENVNGLLGTSFDVPSFALPIGISFYTFQTISYTVDVYRGEVRAQRSFMKFLMFVSLYSQLVAGPIVRYQDIASEIDDRKVSADDVSTGITRFCQGLFKKVFFANVAGELADPYLQASAGDLSVAGSWFGILMFSLQIYYDFSGYSDMAIGLGRMFGFHFLENFNYPYAARSATEFWRRWHMSLGSFFRDYVYVPLGGNRSNFYRNLFIVWFLTGLWHGASWNFIFWGLYFGLLIAVERLFLLNWLKRIPALLSNMYLLFVALLGWVIFYFSDLNLLGAYLSALFGQLNNPSWDSGLLSVLSANMYWLLLAVLFCFPVFDWIRSRRIWSGRLASVYGVPGLNLIWNAVILIISVSFLVGKTYNPFLYFRF